MARVSHDNFVKTLAWSIGQSKINQRFRQHYTAVFVSAHGRRQPAPNIAKSFYLSLIDLASDFGEVTYYNFVAVRIV